MVAATGAIGGTESGAPVSAATSRATPSTERQSARLGVSLMTKTLSSSARTRRTSAPTGASAGSARSPLWSCDSPSSRAEQSIPRLSTPRIVATLISNGRSGDSPGSRAPTTASGAFMPAATLGAPHTTCNGSPLPTATRHTVSLSAFGWRSMASTSPTTTPEKPGATGRTSSTSSPDIVSRCASSSVVNAGSTIVRSQRSENCMALRLQRGGRTEAQRARRADAVRRPPFAATRRDSGAVATISLRLAAVSAHAASQPFTRTASGTAGRRRRRAAGRRCRSGAS